MSKELEALEELKMQVGNIHYFDFSKGYPNQTTIELRDSELFTTIEKSLKALEIIKEKRVNVSQFVNWVVNAEEHNERNDYKAYSELGRYVYAISDKTLTQEEYDLLREVLL